MAENEIREAIEIVKKSHPYATKYKGVKDDEALQTLVSLAEEYLKDEGWPEEKPRISSKYKTIDFLEQDLMNKGFNEALRLCKLAVVKKGA